MLKMELCKVHTALYSKPILHNLRCRRLRTKSFLWDTALESWLGLVSSWRVSRAKVSLATVCAARGILFWAAAAQTTQECDWNEALRCHTVLTYCFDMSHAVFVLGH